MVGLLLMLTLSVSIVLVFIVLESICCCGPCLLLLDVASLAKPKRLLEVVEDRSCLSGHRVVKC